MNNSKLSDEFKKALSDTVDQIKKLTPVEMHRLLVSSSKMPYAKTLNLLSFDHDNFCLLSKYSDKTVEEVIDIVCSNVYTGLDELITVIKWFEETPYKDYIKVNEFEKNYIYVTINTPNIIIGFCNAHHDEPTEGWPSYLYINGRICFDHEKLYDKWSNAHQPYFLPRTKDQFDNLLKIINYVGTDEYYDSYMNDDEIDDETTPIDDIYNQLEDLADWTNYVESCIPQHLRHLYKEE